MRTDNPQSVIATLGTIDDELAEMQLQHSQLDGKVKKGKEFLKTYAGVLFGQAEGTDGQRKARALELMHDSKEYTDHLVDLEQLGELDRRYDYLDTRKSIAQSILGFQKEELKLEGWGKARGQAGAREPADG